MSRLPIVAISVLVGTLLACTTASNAGSPDDGPDEAGGSGGGAGTGGLGGTGGTGGETGCPWLPEATCGQTRSVRAWLPQAGAFPAAWHAVRDFEVSGHLLEQRHLETNGAEALIVAIPGEDVPLVVAFYPGREGVDPPLVPGDEVTVAFDASSSDLVGGDSHATLQIRDAAGRVVWAFHALVNVPEANPLPHEIRTLAITPSCHVSGTLVEGLAYDLSFRGGPPFHVVPGQAVPFTSDGGEGRFYLGSSGQTEPLCVAERDFRSELTAYLRLDDPGPARPRCLADADCGSDQYCERGARACDEQGRCLPRPTGCRDSSVLGPVCACDGRAYETACAAHLAGTDASPRSPACEGLFPCGWSWCRGGEAACVRSERPWGEVPIPPVCARPGEILPIPDGCDPDAPSCACFAIDRDDRPCTCTEPTPGELRVHCEG